MPRRTSKRVVVDANVARAAGKTIEAPLSTTCRNVLMSLLKTRHRLVLSAPFEEEWKRHESGFARKWRTSMQQKGLVLRLKTNDFAALGRRIQQIEDATFPKDALTKDLHVFACALATDRIIISNEVRLRKHLVRLGEIEPQVNLLMWASPATEGEACCNWLRCGAPHAVERQVA